MVGPGCCLDWAHNDLCHLCADWEFGEGDEEGAPEPEPTQDPLEHQQVDLSGATALDVGGKPWDGEFGASTWEPTVLEVPHDLSDHPGYCLTRAAYGQPSQEVVSPRERLEYVAVDQHAALPEPGERTAMMFKKCTDKAEEFPSEIKAMMF